MTFSGTGAGDRDTAPSAARALSRHPDGVGVTQVMRRKPPPYAGLDGDAPQLLSNARRCQRPPASASVDHAEQRPNGVTLCAASAGAAVPQGPGVSGPTAATMVSGDAIHTAG